jgi:subtilisin family serine protease
MAAGRREQVDPTRITFRSGITIHPQPGMGPGVREALSDSSVQESDRYWLIQFRYPFPTEARTRLEDVGVVFYDYLDVAALYARVPGGAALLLEEMLQAGEVRYVGSIPAEAKVRPALAARAAQSLALEREIVVLTFDEPTPAQVAELGRLMAIEGQLSGPIHVVRGIAPGASILALVNLDSVRWVEEQGGAELGNLDGGMGVGADVVRATGFDGTGVQVMVVDSGIARDGDTYHPDLQGDRILDQYDFQNGDDNAADDYVLNNGHGTHVAGTIGGRYDAGDPNSNHSYQGVAPDVDFLIYRLFGVDNPFDPTWFSLALERATSEGRTAHVSSNSWAQVKSSGVYSVTSEFADAAVRGAFNGHPVNVVAAAMNDAYLVRSPGTGKNVVTVGAVKDGNSAPGTLVWNKYCGDLEYNWPPGERVCYSNHGPIDTDEDGQTRVKPDLVAPGAMITSAAPWYLPFTSDYYFTTHGTSMAAPHVSGAIAQLLDAYSEVWGGWLFDWPEMVKAMLLATAVDVGGDTDLYGHGLLDAYHAITWQPGVDEPMNLWADSVSLSREIQDFDLYVPPGYEEVRVVLTWADPPDATEVVNDLDVLGIKDGEGIWRSGAASLDDTVEYVRMAAGYTPGTWTIRVRATSIADPPQPFALAAHVILAEADLSIRAAPTSVPGAMPAFEAGEEFYLHQYVSNSGYTAGGSYAKLHVPEGFTVVGATVYTQEGYGHWYDASELYHDPDSAPDDRYVALGETLAGFERHVRWLIEIDEGMACGGYPFESTAYWREGGGERSSSTVITQVPVTCEFLYLPLVLRGD